MLVAKSVLSPIKGHEFAIRLVPRFAPPLGSLAGISLISECCSLPRSQLKRPINSKVSSECCPWKVAPLESRILANLLIVQRPRKVSTAGLGARNGNRAVSLSTAVGIFHVRRCANCKDACCTPATQTLFDGNHGSLQERIDPQERSFIKRALSGQKSTPTVLLAFSHHNRLMTPLPSRLSGSTSPSRDAEVCAETSATAQNGRVRSSREDGQKSTPPSRTAPTSVKRPLP